MRRLFFGLSLQHGFSGRILLARVGLLLLSSVLLSCLLLTSSTKRETPPNVIVLMLDTIRADHVGAYGYQRETSPALNEFAKESVVYKHAYSTTPWTPVAVASIFTGLYGSTHGMVPVNSRELAAKESIVLRDNLDTLAERLKREGYQTLGVTPNPWTTETFNFDQGFDLLQFKERARADLITNSAIKMIDKSAATPDKPLFLYVHYLDAHDPYDPPKPYSEMFTGTAPGVTFPYEPKMVNFINQYDGEIRYMDDHLSRLFAKLKSSGLYDNSLIIVVADHGEQFKEHGRHRHGFQLYDEEVHVPLMVRYPHGNLSGSAIEDSVSLIDITPTVLDVVNSKGNTTMLQGVSLMRKDQLAARKSLFMEVRRHHDMKGVATPDGDKALYEVALKDDDESRKENFDSWYARSHMVGVFNPRIDPTEISKIDDEALANRLTALFENQARSVIPQVSASLQTGEGMTDEVSEDLQALGYLDEE